MLSAATAHELWTRRRGLEGQHTTAAARPSSPSARRATSIRAEAAEPGRSAPGTSRPAITSWPNACELAMRLNAGAISPLSGRLFPTPAADVASGPGGRSADNWRALPDTLSASELHWRRGVHRPWGESCCASRCSTKSAAHGLGRGRKTSCAACFTLRADRALRAAGPRAPRRRAAPCRCGDATELIERPQRQALLPALGRLARQTGLARRAAAPSCATPRPTFTMLAARALLARILYQGGAGRAAARALRARAGQVYPSYDSLRAYTARGAPTDPARGSASAARHRRRPGPRAAAPRLLRRPRRGPARRAGAQRGQTATKQRWDMVARGRRLGRHHIAVPEHARRASGTAAGSRSRSGELWLCAAYGGRLGQLDRARGRRASASRCT